MDKKDLSHIPRKHELWSLIRRLGDLWGEDDYFTKEYAKDVYKSCMEDLGSAIECFKGAVCQGELIGIRKRWLNC